MNKTSDLIPEAVNDRKTALLGIIMLAVIAGLIGYASSDIRSSLTRSVSVTDTSEQTTTGNSGSPPNADNTQQVNISRDEIVQIRERFLPSEEVLNTPRPYTVNSQKVIFAEDGLRLLAQQDPSADTTALGMDKNRTPIIPGDLTEQQQEKYISILYGDDLDWKEEARTPGDATTVLGGCVACNAPAGAGGCGNKQAVRGLVYTLVKEGWSRERIMDEATLVFKTIFRGRGPLTKWAVYYNQTGRDPATLTGTLDKMSNYGVRTVRAKLAGKEAPDSASAYACGG